MGGGGDTTSKGLCVGVAVNKMPGLAIASLRVQGRSHHLCGQQVVSLRKALHCYYTTYDSTQVYGELFGISCLIALPEGLRIL